MSSFGKQLAFYRRMQKKGRQEKEKVDFTKGEEEVATEINITKEEFKCRVCGKSKYFKFYRCESCGGVQDVS